MPGSSSGSHKAGSRLGVAPGAQGKAQPPPSGQTLQRLICFVARLSELLLCTYPFSLVIGIAPKELLREVGEIMG